MQRTKHQNIVKLYDILNTPRYVHLVMEFIPGVSLHHYLRFKPGHKLDENESKKLFFQIVQCVKYCHDSNISHRDLKLENLLLSDKN